jgi:uncharacterized protein (DUF1501 family)
MISRRRFLSLTGRLGLAGATAPLWSNAICQKAFAQNTLSNYKAVVLVTLIGGNDGNNMLIPLDNDRYRQYVATRPSIALSQASCLPLAFGSSAASYGLHPSLTNVANYYNKKRALFVANVGPLAAPATKAQLLQSPSLIPASLMNHVAGRAQWESATTGLLPATGWGGRMADLLKSQSGALPPLLDAGPASVFTVGQSIQAIAVQANSGLTVALPAGINSAVLRIANADATSQNGIVAQAAKLRVAAYEEQALIGQAQSAGASLQTVFPATGFGNVMKTIAQVIGGRSVIGASRQIFYANQGNYDTHGSQLPIQAAYLAELDAGLGAFMSALDEMGLGDQVLVCTHSDFNRTMQANTAIGTDHAWGNHQLILGGMTNGGRVAGTMPDLDLGGSYDLSVQAQGVWIPTTSVSQMTGGIGSWMGLSAAQVNSVFPDLTNFGGQVVQLA